MVKKVVSSISRNESLLISSSRSSVSGQLSLRWPRTTKLQVVLRIRNPQT